MPALLALLLLLSTGAHAQNATEFSLPSAGGETSLSQFSGKVVYLDFWASWCAPCRKAFPWMNEMQQKYAAQGLQVIGINLDRDRADAAEFLQNTPAQFLVAYDPAGKTAQDYKVMGMPTSYLISRDGKIISTHIGFRESKKEKLEQAIREALQ